MCLHSPSSGGKEAVGKLFVLVMFLLIPESEARVKQSLEGNSGIFSYK